MSQRTITIQEADLTRMLDELAQLRLQRDELQRHATATLEGTVRPLRTELAELRTAAQAWVEASDRVQHADATTAAVGAEVTARERVRELLRRRATP